MPPTGSRKPARFTSALHEKFRSSIKRLSAKRSPHFVKSQRAYVRRLAGGKTRVYRGVHSTVERAFGKLGRLIAAAGGCGSNSGPRSRTRTSRGLRVGRELCRMAKTGTTSRAHEWTRAVATALRRWGVHLIAGEVPVARGHVATGVDLLCVRRHPTEPRQWQLVCVELKTGYLGDVWRAAPLGETDAGVKRSVLNYALTQAQLTHECARATFHEYEFAAPMVVLVNSEGVKRFSPDERVEAQGRALLA